jgi:nucleoside-diphosphate-sugar epimerase
MTGGTGALGKTFSRYLRDRGYNVVCTSRKADGGDATVHLDLSDASQVSSVVQALHPEIVIHLAATFNSPFEDAYSVNVDSAKHLLDAIDSGHLKTRLVLAGSAAEYGLVAPEENPVREDRLLHPVSVYGLTKSWQTTLGLMYAHRGLDVVVARIFNLWGTGLSSQLFAGRVDQQVRDVLAGKQERISVGPLSAIRDYISLGEAAEQIIAIAERGKSGQVYHVASGQPVSMRELLLKRLKLDGLDFQIVDESTNNSSRVGYDVPAIYADISKTTALLDRIEDARN